MNTITYQTDEDETVCEGVVNALTTATDTPAASLQPLYASVDPDALNSIFDGNRTGRVVFSHVGHRITVRSCGTIDVDRSR